LYGLGATLYALLTGRPPFDGTGYGLVKKHLVERPASLRAHTGEVPPRLDALVLRLLAKDPRARGTAASLSRELEALAREREGPLARKLLWPLAALVALGVALAAALLSGSQGGE